MKFMKIGTKPDTFYTQDTSRFCSSSLPLKGNLLSKLESFFHSCVLQGWKDSIVTLQSTAKLPDWCENLGIIRKSIDSIVEKILTPTAKVSWSHTYTRSGHQATKRNSITLFQETGGRRTYQTSTWTYSAVLSQQPGQASRCRLSSLVKLCTYTPVVGCHTSNQKSLSGFSVKQNEAALERHPRAVNTVLNMIPADKGSVSEVFLLRLVSIAS